ncbi:MAG: glycosyltransferase family 2 protein [Chloroflexi bacterium]|nr:glycosyltransferase family 2 protein [Chloroflexota bacterium]
MLISVITTTFNSRPYLEEAIQSVLSQERVVFEYVIVDDGSTDGTEDVVAAIDDARIHYINNGRIGRAKALNCAVQTAQGTYIANLDADDMMLPGRLAKQSHYLNTHPQVGLIGSAYYLATAVSHQTLPPIEITLIVDEASTDGAQKMTNNY